MPKVGEEDPKAHFSLKSGLLGLLHLLFSHKHRKHFISNEISVDAERL